jgi:hypothetical protein
MTLEPRRFVDFIEQIPDNPTSPWHMGLRRFAGGVESYRDQFDAGDFVYIPTGGGIHRQVSEYGDAIAPPAYIQRQWGEKFALRAYIDNPSQYWQAVAIMQRI